MLIINQPTVVVLNTIIPSLLSLCKKSKTFDCFHPEILMIKESWNLIAWEHILVYVYEIDKNDLL